MCHPYITIAIQQNREMKTIIGAAWRLKGDYHIIAIYACGMCPCSTYMASATTKFISSYFTSVLREIALEQNMLSISMYLQLCPFLASLKCTYATFRW